MLIKLALFSLFVFANAQQNIPLNGPENTFQALYEQLQTNSAETKTFADVQPPAKFHTLSEAISALEKFFETIKLKLALPSLVVGFSVRNKTVFSKAWGQANLEDGIEAQVGTTYRVASISKSFTSLVLGMLVDQGLVKYSDLLSKYLKPADYPQKSFAGHQVNITLSQLLSHTAGEPFTDLNDVATFHPEVTNMTTNIRLPHLSHAPLTFAPGTSYNYSNYGYNLLGAVIESVTKKSYQVVLQDFFAKHGFTGSAVDTGSVLVHHSARYYRPDPSNKDLNVPTSLIDGLLMANGWWAAGSVMSNVPDLLRYGNLLLDAYKGRQGSVVSKATLSQIWTSRTDGLHISLPSGMGYGYGWVITDLSKLPNSTATSTFKHKHFNWHNGGLFGTSTYLAIYPEEEAVGVVLTNKGDAQSAIMLAMMQMMENVYDLIK